MPTPTYRASEIEVQFESKHSTTNVWNSREHEKKREKNVRKNNRTRVDDIINTMGLDNHLHEQRRTTDLRNHSTGTGLKNAHKEPNRTTKNTPEDEYLKNHLGYTTISDRPSAFKSKE